MSACLCGNRKTGNVYVAPSLFLILNLPCNCLTDMSALVLNKKLSGMHACVYYF